MFRMVSISGFVLIMVCSAMAAKVKVEGDNAVQYSELKKSAFVNVNRRYTFDSVPKELEGMVYTLHAHRGMAKMGVEVQLDLNLNELLKKYLNPLQICISHLLLARSN